MGNERKTETVQQTQQQQTRIEPTAQEKEFNELELQRQRSAQPGMMQAQQQGLSLINQLLTGQALPGYLQGLPGGISPGAIGAEATRLSAQNMAGFQNLGISDSGPAFKETASDIANRVLFPAEQFNLQNLSQLLNLAVGGQASVQQPILGGASTLAQSLAGLRSTMKKEVVQVVV